MPPPAATMIEVCIPALERKADESGKLQKFFRVEILFNGRKHFVLKRHREFLNLHKKLKKILQTPEFPNKRSPHFRQKPLEQRRQELEDYVKMVLSDNEEVPQEMLDFLQLKHFHSVNKMSSSECLDASHPESYNCQLLHQRVLGFFKDPYVLESTSDLPDVVVDGVLQGLYPRDVRVSFMPPPEPHRTKPWSPSKGGPATQPEVRRT
ncbi:sorting nexin-22 [Paramormyrops kingsleyae]|uniref:Sorting nexin 22 n=1 Tax=Paramormyrops kingsleyae TaxID=1676925 RepID=A0A3B3QPJ6_9TELE|nr:sorting nexin-24-like [Paramormyrops kingsleyae]